MNDVYGIAAYRSRQQVLMLESALRRQGLSVDVKIVTTPREVSMGCGLSARFELSDAPHVARTVRRMNTGNLIGLYRVEYANGRTKLSPLRA